jgi:hypothetical protein
MGQRRLKRWFIGLQPIARLVPIIHFLHGYQDHAPHPRPVPHVNFYFDVALHLPIDRIDRAGQHCRYFWRLHLGIEKGLRDFEYCRLFLCLGEIVEHAYPNVRPVILPFFPPDGLGKRCRSVSKCRRVLGRSSRGS